MASRQDTARTVEYGSEFAQRMTAAADLDNRPLPDVIMAIAMFAAAVIAARTTDARHAETAVAALDEMTRAQLDEMFKAKRDVQSIQLHSRSN